MPMSKQEYFDFHAQMVGLMTETTRKKNSDYTGDGASPFHNFEQIAQLVKVPSVVEIGFLTRMSDKMSRIGSYITKGELLVRDESVTDSLVDLANYCLLFAGFLESKRREMAPVQSGASAPNEWTPGVDVLHPEAGK